MKNIIKLNALKMYGYIQIAVAVLLLAVSTGQMFMINDISSDISKYSPLIMIVASMLTCCILLIIPLISYFRSIKFCLSYQTLEQSCMHDRCTYIYKTNIVSSVILIVASILVYGYINILPIILIITGILPCFNYKIYLKIQNQ